MDFLICSVDFLSKKKCSGTFMLNDLFFFFFQYVNIKEGSRMLYSCAAREASSVQKAKLKLFLALFKIL